jgi:hypothetical protein
MKKSNSIFSLNFTNKPIDFPNDDLRNDRLFVLMAVNYNSKYYEKISNELKYDKQIIYNAVMCDSYVCKCVVRLLVHPDDCCECWQE